MIDETNLYYVETLIKKPSQKAQVLAIEVKWIEFRNSFDILVELPGKAYWIKESDFQWRGHWRREPCGLLQEDDTDRSLSHEQGIVFVTCEKYRQNAHNIRKIPRSSLSLSKSKDPAWFGHGNRLVGKINGNTKICSVSFKKHIWFSEIQKNRPAYR